MRDSTISDRRIMRDDASLTRSAIPFGQNFVSSLNPIGSRVTSGDSYRAVPPIVWGDAITYADTIASTIAFPSGVTRWFPAKIGLNYLPEVIGSIEAIGCSATIVSNTAIKTSVNVTSTGSNPHGFNATIPSLSGSFTSVRTVDRPYVIQGLSGYSIESLADRAIAQGEILLPGNQKCFVKTISSPTMPEVFLRLWISLNCSNGTTEGLDLSSIAAAAALCRSNGYLYNGDVFPDYLEAWLYQAAHCHGLRVTRTRTGLGFESMGLTGAAQFLLTSANSQDITRSWSEVPLKPREVRSVVRWDDEEYVDVGSPLNSNRSNVEELLGIRISDTAHITSIEKLWDDDRNLNQETSGIFVGKRATGFALTLGTRVLIPGIGRGQFSGAVTELLAASIVPSWDSVLVSGFPDSIGTNFLIDTSKNFLASVQAGDLVELTGAGGEVSLSPVISVEQTRLTIEASATTSSYRVFDLTPDPSWTLAVETPSGIQQIPIVPTFDPIRHRVIYASQNINPLTGSALAIGKLKKHRITSVRGPKWIAIG